jgi:hypothetical protein
MASQVALNVAKIDPAWNDQNTKELIQCLRYNKELDINTQEGRY